MRVKVLKVDDETKQTQKGTKYQRAQCAWGDKKVWTSVFSPVQAGCEYEAEIEPWEGRNGKTNYSIRNCKPLTEAAPTNGTQAAQPSKGYPARAYLALDDAIGKQVQGYADNEDGLKSTVYGCMWISMSKDPVVMAEMEAVKEGVRGGAPSSGDDELPPDGDLSDY